MYLICALITSVHCTIPAYNAIPYHGNTEHRHFSDTSTKRGTRNYEGRTPEVWKMLERSCSYNKFLQTWQQIWIRDMSYQCTFQLRADDSYWVHISVCFQSWDIIEFLCQQSRKASVWACMSWKVIRDQDKYFPREILIFSSGLILFSAYMKAVSLDFCFTWRIAGGKCEKFTFDFWDL